MTASGPASASADAAALGLSVLAEIMAGVQEGITVCDPERRFVYANPAACQMLRLPFEQLRGRDFLEFVPARERALALVRYYDQLSPSANGSRFTGVLSRPDGTECEMVCSTFPIDIAGTRHGVTISQDVTDHRAAGRTAVALGQGAAQLVGTDSTDEILADIARHAVDGTAALACGIAALDEDHRLAAGGGYGQDYGLGHQNDGRTAAWSPFAGAGSKEVIEAMTSGWIVVGAPPGPPVVLPDARAVWEAHPVLKDVVAALNLDWRAGVYLPLSWEGRVFGLFAVYLPPGVTGPSDTELAFYAALADQAAVAVTNARLASSAGEAAASLERTRLARELHDSVSQALFSMTMHARAAQLVMQKADVDNGGPLGHSIAQLVELSRGALAEMRALIFELRPAALAEEGLVAALAKQAAALSAREQLTATVEGPERRLTLGAEVEEHLYRMASEALHNVVKHARADHATVSVSVEGGAVRVTVRDDGTGFDPERAHPGHLGLSTMAARAEAIGARLTLSSAPGAGTTVTVWLPGSQRAEQNGALDVD